MPANSSSAIEKRSGSILAAFLVSAVTGIALFFIPAFIIRPFRRQSSRALLLAMSLRQHGPWFTLICAVLCLLLASALWRAASRWRKSLLLAALLAASFSAVMARMNYFEWMFHPIDGPQFASQTESKLDANEMIMAVRFGGDARAYPISQMAYHHILNDVVGGVPLAVTY